MANSKKPVRLPSPFEIWLAWPEISGCWYAPYGKVVSLGNGEGVAYDRIHKRYYASLSTESRAELNTRIRNGIGAFDTLEAAVAALKVLRTRNDQRNHQWIFARG